MFRTCLGILSHNSNMRKSQFHMGNADKSAERLDVLKEGVKMTPGKRVSRHRSLARDMSHKVIALEVKVVDRYMPDKLLLFCMNLLDKRVPSKVKSAVVDSIGKYVPDKIRASALIAADEYVPDDVANSRKICAVVAGIAKYIPEKIIPTNSAERWEKLRVRFHIPTLIEGTQPWGPSLN